MVRHNRRRCTVIEDVFVKSIRAICTTCAVLIAGSRGANLHHDEISDFDLVIVGPEHDRAAMFENVVILLCAAGLGPVQVLRNAFTPLIKIGNVDIIVAAIPPASFQREEWISYWNRNPRVIPDVDVTVLDDISLRAIHSLKVCSLLGAQPEPMKVVMREVKMWARERAIYGATLGFWGGVAWSLFVYYTRASSLREALLTLCMHPWPQPIGEGGEENDAICTIFTPFHPNLNTTHACTLPTLREMILLAEETLNNTAGDVFTLQTPIFHHNVMITCDSKDRELVMTRVRHLIPVLERPHVFVRPRACFSALNVMTLGLEPLPGAWTEEVQHEIAHEVSEWCARMDVVVMVSVV